MTTKPITTVTVDPDRLERGQWSHEHSKTIGEGDISRSYSADTIAMQGRVRRPFEHQGVLWVCVGLCSHPFECAKAYRLIDDRLFSGEPTTYAEKVRDSEAARSDPMGFHHGMSVTHGGRGYVLTGPEIVFIAGEREQLELFGE